MGYTDGLDVRFKGCLGGVLEVRRRDRGGKGVMVKGGNDKVGSTCLAYLESTAETRSS